MVGEAFLKLVRINGPQATFKRAWVELQIHARRTTMKKAVNLVKLNWARLNLSTEVPGLPAYYMVEPTNGCHLRCPYCLGFQGRPVRKIGKMPLEIFSKIIDEISPYAYRIKLYNRGESLLHDDFFKMVRYATDHKVGVVVSSNMSFEMDEEMTNSFVESGLDHLVVPVDGATQKSYETYRVRGKLDLVLENIRKVAEKKKETHSSTPYITVRVIAMRSNEHEIEEIRRIAYERGANNVFVVPMYLNPTAEGAENWIPVDSLLSWDYKMNDNMASETRGKPCPELWQEPTINWDGNVYPCCGVDNPELSFGSLLERGIDDIWHSPALRASRQVFRNDGEPEMETVCTKCKGMVYR